MTFVWALYTLELCSAQAGGRARIGYLCKLPET